MFLIERFESNLMHLALKGHLCMLYSHGGLKNFNFDIGFNE